MASSAKYVNPDAEVVAKEQALALNCAAANGLQMVLRSNLGKIHLFQISMRTPNARRSARSLWRAQEIKRRF